MPLTFFFVCGWFYVYSARGWQTLEYKLPHSPATDLLELPSCWRIQRYTMYSVAVALCFVYKAVDIYYTYTMHRHRKDKLEKERKVSTDGGVCGLRCSLPIWGMTMIREMRALSLHPWDLRGCRMTPTERVAALVEFLFFFIYNSCTAQVLYPLVTTAFQTYVISFCAFQFHSSWKSAFSRVEFYGLLHELCISI